MTRDDRMGFVQVFNRLAVACRLPAKEADAAMQRIYFQGLEEFSLDVVSAAGDELAKTAQWFPKVAEWRDASKVQHIASVKALPDGRDREWQEECVACSDTGWEERRCYPGTRQNCGRKKCQQERAEHRYSSPCVCRATNRTYQRHHTLKDRVPYGG